LSYIGLGPKTEFKNVVIKFTTDVDMALKLLNLLIEHVSACVVAEVSTSLSPRCCERLVEAGAEEVIVRLMRSCNRSLPHMEIITYCIAILLNLSKVANVLF
jgi:hypothetical protein